jgi:hypothetical protein
MVGEKPLEPIEKSDRAGISKCDSISRNRALRRLGDGVAWITGSPKPGSPTGQREHSYAAEYAHGERGRKQLRVGLDDDVRVGGDCYCVTHKYSARGFG